MRRGITTVIATLTLTAGVAFATAPPASALFHQHYHFVYGPVHINPGQNVIQFSGPGVPKPPVEGWITSIRPNILLPKGNIPPVDIIHLHHAVWLNLSNSDMTQPSIPERFYATGEEKTRLQLPTGYGYHVKPSDSWLLNYMIHDLVNQSFDIRLTYDINFVPKTAGTLTDVHPIWMDVQNGSNYPVFDSHRGSGTGGQFTYPDQAVNPYPGAPKNVFTMPQGGTLVWAGGHLHPGGLWDDLYVDRGASTAHVFRSDAKYFEPAGPVSWDVTLGVTKPIWKVNLNPGDKLRVTTTYDSSQRSWYEGMGIMQLWFAPNITIGTDPFALTAKQLVSRYTHGHLKENNNHGGAFDPGLPDPATLADGPLTTEANIDHFEYNPGDNDDATETPTVHQGQSIEFTNYDAPTSGYGIWHTITSCALPCNLSTGVAYPTANGDADFDSGQLGNDGQPTAGRLSWSTPSDLPEGTYAYFCRVHPFMRGSFRVVAP